MNLLSLQVACRCSLLWMLRHLIVHYLRRHRLPLEATTAKLELSLEMGLEGDLCLTFQLEIPATTCGAFL